MAITVCKYLIGWNPSIGIDTIQKCQNSVVCKYIRKTVYSSENKKIMRKIRLLLHLLQISESLKSKMLLKIVGFEKNLESNIIAQSNPESIQQTNVRKPHCSKNIRGYTCHHLLSKNCYLRLRLHRFWSKYQAQLMCGQAAYISSSNLRPCQPYLSETVKELAKTASISLERFIVP